MRLPLPEDEAQRWTEEAPALGIRKIAILSQDYPSINGHVKALLDELPDSGIRRRASLLALRTREAGSLKNVSEGLSGGETPHH